MLGVDGLRATVEPTHSYGSKHKCCRFSDSHGASGLRGDSLTERRRNSDDKKRKRWTRVINTEAARRTVKNERSPKSRRAMMKVLCFYDLNSTDSLLFGCSKLVPGGVELLHPVAALVPTVFQLLL